MNERDATPGEAARALWWGDGTRHTMTPEQDAAKWDAIANAAIEASEGGVSAHRPCPVCGGPNLPNRGHCSDACFRASMTKQLTPGALVPALLAENEALTSARDTAWEVRALIEQQYAELSTHEAQVTRERDACRAELTACRAELTACRAELTACRAEDKP